MRCSAPAARADWTARRAVRAHQHDGRVPRRAPEEVLGGPPLVGRQRRVEREDAPRAAAAVGPPERVLGAAAALYRVAEDQGARRGARAEGRQERARLAGKRRVRRFTGSVGRAVYQSDVEARRRAVEARALEDLQSRKFGAERLLQRPRQSGGDKNEARLQVSQGRERGPAVREGEPVDLV